VACPQNRVSLPGARPALRQTRRPLKSNELHANRSYSCQAVSVTIVLSASNMMSDGFNSDRQIRIPFLFRTQLGPDSHGVVVTTATQASHCRLRKPKSYGGSYSQKCRKDDRNWPLDATAVTWRTLGGPRFQSGRAREEHIPSIFHSLKLAQRSRRN
jgi:hypothetical protein